LPSDSNGVYSLPSGYLAITGETIQASQHNPPLEDLATAMTARMTRSGAAPMTGPLKVVDGSVGSPAIQFSNAPSTGFYRTTNGFGLSINGTKVAEFGPGGIVSGARWIGELVPFTGLTAPPLTVFPFGQTLSRTTYADLWTFAQAEIAAGNTFYNNGDGSATFGIGDMRGRVAAASDAMGGNGAGRLTFGSALGSTAGTETITLSASQIPAHSHPNTLTDPGHAHPIWFGNGSGTHPVVTLGPQSIIEGAGDPIQGATTGIIINNANNTGGGGSHSNLQPTIITNYVLFAGA
jgi:microcystin-dependent protein